MDPISIVGTVAAIQQLLQVIYRYGRNVQGCKKEINQLCSELLALKAALDHVYLNSNFQDPLLNSTADDNAAELVKDASAILTTAASSSADFQDMLQACHDILHELIGKLQPRISKLASSIQSAVWPLRKDEIYRQIERLHRMTSWFVLVSISDNAAVCRDSFLKLSSIEKILQSQQNVHSRQQSMETRREIRSCLAPSNSDGTLQTLRQQLQQGTGKWFLEETLPQFLDDEKSRFLWLRAKPGSGKSVLLAASIAVTQEYLDTSGDGSPLLYFFCSFSNTDTQKLSNILGAFVIQLCDSVPSLWSELEAEYLEGKASRSQQSWQPESSFIESYLCRGLNSVSRPVVILDALNESPQHEEILACFGRICKCTTSRLIMSSTQDIKVTMTDLPGKVISFDKVGIARDIGLYVKMYLESDNVLQGAPRELKEKIVRTLTEDHDGV